MLPVIVSTIAAMAIAWVSLGIAQGKRYEAQQNYKLLHTGI